MRKFFKKSKTYVLALLLGAICFIFINGKNPDSYFEISKNLDLFATLFKELNESYVDPIEPGKIVKKGIDAMLKELDPYTVYITEDDIEDYRYQTTGQYGGIGSTVLKKGDYVVIDEPYENSPTLKAGIKAGDIIIAINGKSTKGKSVSDLSDFLKGAPGTTVKLSIRDPFTQKEEVKTVTRGKISVSSVPYSGMVGPDRDIAYVKLTSFTMHAGSLMRKELDSLKKANPGMKGVVVDLRDNPGGLLGEAVNICNIFIPNNQLVVSTKGKMAESKKNFKTRGAAWDEKIPVTVLTSSRSASASEIVAGTLQDLDRAVVVGQKSFGKGLVQTTRPLSFNAKLKVTTAKYYTPSGRCIQAIDYSSRNLDGSLAKIPDSLKTQYKTNKGRPVWDGGGVEPDLSIEKEKLSWLLPTLIRKHFIFDYANEYVRKHSSIASASEFEFSEQDFQNFASWLEGKDYGYNTSAEDALEEFKEEASRESYFEGVESEYNQLKKALSHDKKQDLIKNKKMIVRALQNEIVSRYWYQKGKYQNALIKDAELDAAVKVLNEQSRYKSILKM